jgi:hypothetical protein
VVEARARRVFVAAWILLGLAGALDHTIAQKLLGTRIDLLLPHLRFGYVMFNRNPRTVPVYEYAGRDGARHALAELVAAPAPGYARARLIIDAASAPAYLREVCLRAGHTTMQEYDFFVETYAVDVGKRSLENTRVLHCSEQGLRDATAAR